MALGKIALKIILWAVALNSLNFDCYCFFSILWGIVGSIIVLTFVNVTQNQTVSRLMSIMIAFPTLGPRVHNVPIHHFNKIYHLSPSLKYIPFIHVLSIHKSSLLCTFINTTFWFILLVVILGKFAYWMLIGSKIIFYLTKNARQNFSPFTSLFFHITAMEKYFSLQKWEW